MGRKYLESSSAEKVFGVSVDSKLGRSLLQNVPRMSNNAIFSCKSIGPMAQNKDTQTLFIYILENLTVRQQFYIKLLLA